ncbi:MAG: hypothetical protein WCT31_05305 [Candidatus Micrarchaeia archaeon]|jgi:hypothetical protein
MGFFDSFVKRVMDAAQAGKLGKDDSGKLKRMFENTKKRNVVLAKGILTALKAGKAKETDIQRLAGLLENANQKISQDKKPFTKQEENDIRNIFQNAGISEKTARWFSLQMDEFLSSEIKEAVAGKTVVPVPTKKTVKMDFSTKKQKLEA